ncbi:hypothetical protein V8E54_010841 [Elaphomyces granulatus]
MSGPNPRFCRYKIMTMIWRGDDFDDMLFDELDLSGLLRRLLRLSLRQLLRCDGCYNGQDGCCDGSCDCNYDPTTKARPPEKLKGQRAQEEEEKARYYGYWQLRRHLCLRFRGFRIAQIHRL